MCRIPLTGRFNQFILLSVVIVLLFLQANVFHLRRSCCPGSMDSKGAKSDGWERAVQFMLCSSLEYSERDVAERIEHSVGVFVGGGVLCCDRALQSQCAGCEVSQSIAIIFRAILLSCNKLPPGFEQWDELSRFCKLVRMALHGC